MQGLKLQCFIMALCLCIAAPVFAEPAGSQHTPGDPLEYINRKMYTLNHHLDRLILKPTAQVYKFILPWPVRNGINNFFSNMGDVPTTINDGLQGNMRHMLNDATRFGFNTTFGILGIFDVASYMGFEKHYNDFGITLARWGVTTAPYLMVPLIGPTTLRDGLAMSVDYEYMTLWPYIRPVRLRNTLFVLDVINLRSQLLDSEDVMDQAAMDPYVFIRDAYLQKRASLINASKKSSQLTDDPLSDDDLDDLDFLDD